MRRCVDSFSCFFGFDSKYSRKYTWIASIKEVRYAAVVFVSG